MAPSARLQDLGIAVHARSVFLQVCCFFHLSIGLIIYRLSFVIIMLVGSNTYFILDSLLSGALGFVQACQGVEACSVWVLSENYRRFTLLASGLILPSVVHLELGLAESTEP